MPDKVNKGTKSMSISPVSPVSAIYGSQPLQNQPPAGKKAGASEAATDTVQLSQAALAHLQAGDKDHDGDSR